MVNGRSVLRAKGFRFAMITEISKVSILGLLLNVVPSSEYKQKIKNNRAQFFCLLINDAIVLVTSVINDWNIKILKNEWLAY